MKSDPLYMGVDVGTTAVKAALFSSAGELQAVETVPTQTDMKAPGWSEQSMDAVWKNAAKAMVGACNKISAENITSVGVCGQGDGLWMLDGDMQPLRPAILWNDQRANDRVSDWIDDYTSDALSKHCRTAIWAGTSGAAFSWIKENEPELVEAVRHVVHCKDWINFNLTGNISTDFSDASIPFLNYEKRAYAEEAFGLLGVEELAGKIPEPVSAISLHGTVLPDVSGDTGIPAETPVATGCIDVAAMVVGMGLHNTGDMCLILGTTAVLAVVIDPAEYSQPPVGATIVHPYLEKWLRVTAPLSGASALDWFNGLDPDKADSGDESFRARNELISAVPAGADGLMFLPFLSGERAPFVEPSATGSFLGITSSTSKPEMARAVMEGAAMSLRHCFAETGLEKPERLFLTGGGARNHLWCDIIASIMNTTIVVSDASDHGLWGAAKIGAAAARLIDLEKETPRFEVLRTHVPDPDDAGIYDYAFKSYKKHIHSSKAQWAARQEFLEHAL